MEVIRALELALALIALVTLPCAIAAVICADEAIEAFRASVRRRRERWSEQRVLGRLERSFGQPRQSFPPVSQLLAMVSASSSSADDTSPGGWHAIPAALRSSASGLLRVLPGARSAPVAEPEPEPEVVALPFEQVAEEIRRLRAERLAIGARDDERRSPVDHAYDLRLREACRALGITEHLAELDDIDHEIEIVRIEGELIDAGMRIR
ncbi:alkylation response protein AidB-like acyl-CoA dehydrogenase [Allocatelliglobosispora scoriae]|uniref:Alkylation response protein AidB-like acyl-CoA dehydrogenase n=1 Tax=Allocatelliglobosispora scoriae TaxID=643052 RepID=A0A841BUI8_9ACTN|nr:hypothetical protein [Allocatelliglobosispora scoriae]MBB5871355.1 alkylation response protein AidB-like acyl-CoA dehydrogenase [Allocatelliglobosispora scoriae]